MSNFIQQYEAQKKALKASISEAVDGWFTQACRDSSTPQYVYFKPHELLIYIGTQAPNANWQLASSQAVSSANTKEQTWRFAYEALQSCEVYPREVQAA